MTVVNSMIGQSIVFGIPDTQLPIELPDCVSWHRTILRAGKWGKVYFKRIIDGRTCFECWMLGINGDMWKPVYCQGINLRP